MKRSPQPLVALLLLPVVISVAACAPGTAREATWTDMPPPPAEEPPAPPPSKSPADTLLAEFQSWLLRAQNQDAAAQFKVGSPYDQGKNRSPESAGVVSRGRIAGPCAGTVLPGVDAPEGTGYHAEQYTGG